MKIFFLILFFGILSCSAPTVSQHEVKNVNERIKVSYPKPFQEVKGKFTVRGEARGSYFFEAGFPVEIELENGENKQFFATALGDWMTTDFVPFEAEIDLSDIPDQEVIVRLIRANPSGMPENDMRIELPVTVKN